MHTTKQKKVKKFFLVKKNINTTRKITSLYMQDTKQKRERKFLLGKKNINTTRKITRL